MTNVACGDKQFEYVDEDEGKNWKQKQHWM